MDVLAAQVRDYLAKHTNYVKTFGLGVDPPVEDWDTIQWALYADALVARVTEAERQLADERFNSRSLSRQLMEKDDALADARNALEDAVGIAIWMSGASAFSPDGEAHEGWLKQRENLFAAMRVLARLDGSARLTEPDQGGTQGIAGESRIAQGMLDGNAPASGSANRVARLDGSSE